jgi:hypothetical protein
MRDSDESLIKTWKEKRLHVTALEYQDILSKKHSKLFYCGNLKFFLSEPVLIIEWNHNRSIPTGRCIIRFVSFTTGAFALMIDEQAQYLHLASEPLVVLSPELDL